MSQHTHHIIPLKTLYQVFMALIVLTVVTVWVAQYDFGVMNGFIAIGIASVKAGFVASIFMGLKYSDRLFAAGLVVTLFFVILLYFLSYVDLITRVIHTNPL